MTPEADLAAVPLALEPLHSMGAPNEPIEVWSGSATVRCKGGGSFDGDATLSVEWLPTPWFTLRVTGGLDLFATPLGDAEFDLQGFAIVRGHIDSSGTSGVTAILTTRELGMGNEFRQVRFDLANAPVLIGRPIQGHSADGGTSYFAGRQIVEWASWRVILDQVEQLSQNVRALKRTRGYMITHTGSLERRNGKFFSARSANEALGFLSELLSFVRGGWVTPVLASGLDSAGSPVWTSTALFKVSPWEEHSTWAPPLERDICQSLAPGFYALRSSLGHREALSVIVHTCIEASRMKTPELGLVLAQTMLELLANVFVGKSQPKAADARIRALLRAEGIPTHLLGTPRHLRSAARKLKAADGPETITRYRNRWVHPELSKLGQSLRLSTYERVGIRDLALRYVELVVLRQAAYDGKHVNRLLRDAWTSDAIQPVPWATGTS